MRIPTSKIYRAFPELDEFSDEQCQRFMQRIRVSGLVQALPWVVFLITAVVGLVIDCAISGFVLDMVEEGLRSRKDGSLLSIIDGVVCLLMIGLPLFFGLIARDLMLRRHLRLVIDERLNRIRCLACKYILIGQVVHDERVACPECGHGMSLAELGIVEADLIPPDMQDPMGRSFV